MLQAIDKLKLETQTSGCPKALGMESCVGTEYVAFSTPLALEGKASRASRQAGFGVAADMLALIEKR